MERECNDKVTLGTSFGFKTEETAKSIRDVFHKQRSLMCGLTRDIEFVSHFMTASSPSPHDMDRDDDPFIHSSALNTAEELAKLFADVTP